MVGGAGKRKSMEGVEQKMNNDTPNDKAPTFKDLQEDADERARLAELEEYRKRAMDQFFQDGSCTGGDLDK